MGITNRGINVGFEPSKVVSLTSGESNSVYQIDDKYLYKKFKSTNRFHREVSGMYLFGLFTKQEIPMFVRQGDSYYLSEFMPNSKSAFDLINSKQLTPEQVESRIATFVGEVFWSYKYFDKSKIALYPSLSWESKLRSIITEFKAFSEQKECLSEKTCSHIAVKLDYIWNHRKDFNLTLTHRDLHLGNVIYYSRNSLRKSSVIDFEHCMEAPIELEFQNCLFWNDEKSLDVERIRHILEYSFRVPYSIDVQDLMFFVYIADQINIALEEQNQEKLEILAQKVSKSLNLRK